MQVFNYAVFVHGRLYFGATTLARVEHRATIAKTIYPAGSVTMRFFNEQTRRWQTVK